MKFNPREVDWNHRMSGGMTGYSYRIPDGNLHKMKYIGYGRRESERMFKREVRALLKGTK